MKWEQLCKLGCELPEVREGIWFRTPSLEVRGKSFVRLKEDGKSVVFRPGPSYPIDVVHYRFLTGDGQEARIAIPAGLGVRA